MTSHPDTPDAAALRGRFPTSLGDLWRWTGGLARAGLRWVRTRHDVEHRRLDALDTIDAPLLGHGKGLQRVEDGTGPLYHRRYEVRLGPLAPPAADVIAWLRRDPNAAVPQAIAVFEPLLGSTTTALELGSRHVVRIAGPWDGPVEVVRVTPTSFRLATLPGHLEAGEIEFRAEDDDAGVVVIIESWARAGDAAMATLHHRLRIAQELQLHMWSDTLRRTADHFTPGTRTVHVTTRHAPHVRRIAAPET